MESITFLLPSELVARIDQISGGPKRRSQFFRQVLTSRVAMGQAHRNPGRGGSVQIYVRLAPDEVLDLDRVAATAGMPRSEWMVALLRRHRAAKPQFSRPDRRLIVEAHRKLHRIAVLMRSIVEHLLSREDSVSLVELQAQLIGAVSEVERQMAAMRQAFEGNFAYWETPDD